MIVHLLYREKPLYHDCICEDSIGYPGTTHRNHWIISFNVMSCTESSNVVKENGEIFKSKDLLI